MTSDRWLGILICSSVAPFLALAQEWDLPARGAAEVSSLTTERVKITAEVRARYEARTENGFGKDADIETALVRSRLGMTVQPAAWLKVGAMAQDVRAPWYGVGAPNNVRDQADLHEAYIQIFPDAKKGFGMTAGRMMLNYGEGRLLGTPQWSNVSRTYDHLRLYQRTPFGRFEFLLVSPVKIRIGEFNRPVLGDRVWGTYNSMPDLFGKNLLDAYYLRHDQNRPGGYTSGSRALGTDRIAINTYGARLAGPLAAGVKYSLEGALQNGRMGPADHRAGAWFSSLSRRWTVNKRTIDLSAEYKYASGSANPQDASRSGTFDQLYPSNHDKFGHEDLFGWRNLHNVRSLATMAITKAFAANIMYDNYWLASPRDSLYNGSGKSIARSAAGTAGRHVGQESDCFVTYKYSRFTFGAGYGRFFAGEFISKATPGRDPNYVYVFHSYSL